MIFINKIIDKNIVVSVMLMLLYVLGISIFKFRIATIGFLVSYIMYLGIDFKKAFIIAFTMTYWLVFFFEYVFKSILP